MTWKDKCFFCGKLDTQTKRTEQDVYWCYDCRPKTLFDYGG